MMKRIMFAILLCVWCFALQSNQARAISPAMMAGNAPAAAVPGPSGTYTYAWDGDHASGTNYLYDNATGVAGTVVGSMTISADYGDTGNGGQVAANDDRINLTTNAPTTGTIWIKVDIRQAYADIAPRYLMAGFSYAAAATLNHVFVRIGQANGKIAAIWKGNNTQVEHESAGAISYSTGTFELIGLSWDNAAGAGSDKLAVYFDGAWQETVNLSMTDWNNTPNTLHICSHPVMGSAVDDVFYCDDFAFISGTYKADNPW